MTEEADDLGKMCLAKGYTPHTKMSLNDGLQELWWEKNEISFPWSLAVALVGFLFFVLVMVKGWPV